MSSDYAKLGGWAYKTLFLCGILDLAASEQKTDESFDFHLHIITYAKGDEPESRGI